MEGEIETTAISCFLSKYCRDCGWNLGLLFLENNGCNPVVDVSETATIIGGWLLFLKVLD